MSYTHTDSALEHLAAAQFWYRLGRMAERPSRPYASPPREYELAVSAASRGRLAADRAGDPELVAWCEACRRVAARAAGTVEGEK